MPDEKAAYTATDANLGGGVGGVDIWEWTRTGPGLPWALKGNVKPVNSTGLDYLVSVTGDHLEMYLQTKRGSILRSSRPGPTVAWSPAATVTELVGFGHLSVSYDGLSILLTQGGMIHVATRNFRTNPWGTPVLLPGVNTGNATNNRPSLSPDGRQIFFSSNGPGSSIWDVWMAQWIGLTTEGVPSLGKAMKIHLAIPSRPGASYQVAMAFSHVTGIPVPGLGTIPLDLDGLLVLSVSNVVPTMFKNFGGYLDIHGEATAAVVIPAASALVGYPFSVAGVTYDAAGINYITNGKDLEINP